jgi:hypothetical protein
MIRNKINKLKFVALLGFIFMRGVKVLMIGHKS